MKQSILFFAGQRSLILSDIRNASACVLSVPSTDFAVMLPASTKEECEAATSIVTDLVRAGCREICCVGQRAEDLHDEIDWIIEGEDALDTVSTWHRNVPEGCDYFVNVAGGGAKDLIALVAGKEDIVDCLQDLVIKPLPARKEQEP